MASHEEIEIPMAITEQGKSKPVVAKPRLECAWGHYHSSPPSSTDEKGFVQVQFTPLDSKLPAKSGVYCIACAADMAGRVEIDVNDWYPREDDDGYYDDEEGSF